MFVKFNMLSTGILTNYYVENPWLSLGLASIFNDIAKLMCKLKGNYLFSDLTYECIVITVVNLSYFDILISMVNNSWTNSCD